MIYMAQEGFEQLVGMTFEVEGERMVASNVTEPPAGGQRLRLEAEDRSSIASLTPRMMQEKRASGELELTTPDPRELHARRDQYARRQDEGRDAQLTTDPEKWANDMDSFDFPGVDTGPTFRDENPNFDTDGFIEDTLSLFD